MMKIIEMQRAVISEELMKAKKKAAKAKTDELKAILEEMLKLSQLNDKLQFAEESVDRLEIALKQQLKKSSHPKSCNNQQQNHSESNKILKKCNLGHRKFKKVLAKNLWNQINQKNFFREIAFLAVFPVQKFIFGRF